MEQVKKTKEIRRVGDGQPGPGRPKGCLNKSTRLAKDAIAHAAEMLGGAERLGEWAKETPENERVFWSSIYTKLLPLQVTGEGGAPLVPPIIQLVRED